MHSILKHLKQCGAGAIVASATIGAGETVLAVRMGPWGGYELLWLILLAAICKSFLTLYLLGRYSAVSGEAVADRLIELPGPRGWLLWTLLILEGLVTLGFCSDRRSLRPTDEQHLGFHRSDDFL